MSNRSNDEIVKIDFAGGTEYENACRCCGGCGRKSLCDKLRWGIIKVTSAGVVETFSDDFGRPGVGIDVSAKNQIFVTDNGDGCVRLLFTDGSTEIVVDEISGCVALLVQDSTLYVGSWNSGASMHTHRVM